MTYPLRRGPSFDTGSQDEVYLTYYHLWKMNPREARNGLILPRVCDIILKVSRQSLGKGGKEEELLLSDYAFLGLLLIAATLFPLVAMFMAFLIRPNKPDPTKKSTYECGLETIGETWVRFRAQYYIYALVFVIFDIETVFLYPWAVAYNQLGLFALVEMFIFLGILVGGLLYAWRKGVLEWL